MDKMELSSGNVNEIVSEINKIFKKYSVSEFQQVSIFELMKFDLYLSNIKRTMHK